MKQEEKEEPFVPQLKPVAGQPKQPQQAPVQQEQPKKPVTLNMTLEKHEVYKLLTVIEANEEFRIARAVSENIPQVQQPTIVQIHSGLFNWLAELERQQQ